jgi:DNA-binding protein HU-beta
MNKTEMIAKVAEEAGITKAAAAKAVDAVFDGVMGALKAGEKATFVGFGTFEVRVRAAREGRNPQDPKKTIKIPAKKVPAFRPGKELKEAVK